MILLMCFHGPSRRLQSHQYRRDHRHDHFDHYRTHALFIYLRLLLLHHHNHYHLGGAKSWCSKAKGAPIITSRCAIQYNAKQTAKRRTDTQPIGSLVGCAKTIDQVYSTACHSISPIVEIIDHAYHRVIISWSGQSSADVCRGHLREKPS